MELGSQFFDAACNVAQEVLIRELIAEVEPTSVAVTPLVYYLPRFGLDGKGDTFVGCLCIARFMSDVFEDGDTTKIYVEQVDEVDTAEIV